MKFVKEFTSDKKGPRIITIDTLEGLIKLLKQSKHYLILKQNVPSEFKDKDVDFSIEVYDYYRE